MIGLIRDRLEERLGATVLLAEELEALTKGTAIGDGTLFVVPYGEAAEPAADLAGGHRQLVTVQVLVGFLLRRHGDPRGAGRLSRHDETKAAIEAALAGWPPEPGGWPLELVGGEGEPLGSGVSLYVQTWSTKRFLTGAPS